MVASVDGPAAVHAGSDGPVLLEVCVVTDDGWGVDALLLPDFVRSSVGVEGAVLCGARVVRRVVIAHCKTLR